METNTAIALSLEDMIFEGRNKAYGAYVLRKVYHQHLSQALLYAVGFFVLLFSAPVVANLLAGKPGIAKVRKLGPVIEMTHVDLEEIKEVAKVKPVEPAAAAKSEAPTIKNTTPKVVDNNTAVVDEIPTQEDLQKANSGTVTSPGDGNTEVGNPLPGEGSGPGTGTGHGETAAPTEVFYSAEFMPEFEGGMPKLMAYLGRNIKYPRAAQAQGLEGTVILSFVVSVTGEIKDVQVLKGLGYGTEEEAVRVIEKMPRWKPGSQNGRNVPVRMTLPIRLELK
ncbi:energy transducer TonB [Rufibacter soli]